MKHKIFIFLAIALMMLSGCGNETVSKEEYDALLAKNESLQREHDSLLSDYEDLQTQTEKIKSDYKELLDAKSEQLVADLPLQYAQAWVDTGFTGTSACSIYEDTLSVTVFTGVELNEENVKSMWKEALSAIKVYGVMSRQDHESFPHNHVLISFYDADFVGVFSISLDTVGGTSSVCVNAPRALELMQWLN